MRNKAWPTRGRPPGRFHSYDEIRLLEYLVRISVKNEVDSSKFFSSFLDAFQRSKAKCGKLSVECRLKTRDYAVFLVTRDYGVVAQFPIPLNILAKNNPLKEFAFEASLLKDSVRESKPSHYQIRDLKAGMKRVNIKARVLQVAQPKLVETRFGFSANVTNIVVTDETGAIQLPLWNKQMGEISAGDMIQVESANVVAFRGARQLQIGRSGKLSVIKNVESAPVK